MLQDYWNMKFTEFFSKERVKQAGGRNMSNIHGRVNYALIEGLEHDQTMKDFLRIFPDVKDLRDGPSMSGSKTLKIISDMLHSAGLPFTDNEHHLLP